MFRAGDTIENPITGERLTFVETASDTDGEVTVVEVTVRPTASSPPRTSTRSRRRSSGSPRVAWA